MKPRQPEVNRSEEIAVYIENLLSHPPSSRAWARHVAPLAQAGERACRVCLERLRRSTPSEAVLLLDILNVLERPDLHDRLIELLHDPSVADQTKAVVLGYLGGVGFDLSEFPVEEIFQDMDVIGRWTMERVVRGLAQDETSLAVWAEAFDEPPPRDLPLYELGIIADIGDPLGAAVVHVLARHPDAGVQERSVPVLLKMGTDRSLTALEELAEEGLSSRARRSAREAAERLRRSGVTPRRWSADDQAGPVVEIWLSAIDGGGDFTLWLARKHPSRRPAWSVISALLNTADGLRDIWGELRLTRAAVRDLRKSFEDDILLYRVNAEYAGRLFRDALHVTAETGGTPPFSFGYWKDFLPADWLTPEPYDPDVTLGPTWPGEVSREMVVSLLNLPEFDTWLFEEPEIYDAAYELLEAVKAQYAAARMSSRAASSKDERVSRSRKTAHRGKLITLSAHRQVDPERVYENLEARLFHTVVKPQLADILRRLRLFADLLLQVGTEPSASMVSRTWVSLSGADVEEARLHPFIRALITRSVEAAIEELQLGPIRGKT